MRKVTADDVEKLSRGQATKARIGSRNLGHRLTQKERILFESAKKKGFLKCPASGSRKNLIRVYQLWCEAVGRTPVIVNGGAS